jgi:molybdopterin/thiamine biosynthesis adenylyltransferase
MTSHVRPPEVDGIATADAWFNSLGKPYQGRLPDDDPLAAGKRTGWLVATRGRHLAVVVDEAFPFTRPKVYLRGDHDPTPHIEADGRLCLANPEIPSDPTSAVMNALRLAQELLDDIDAGREDGDFAEDFTLYWHHSAKSVFKTRLLLPDVDRSAVIHTCATRAAIYGFASNEAARRWWSHRFNDHLRKTRQGALLVLDSLPHPDRYPTTGEELWRLIEGGSQDGVVVLEGLLRQNPKSLLVVLAGTSPGGRRHSVGLVLERPVDPQGRPVNRRIIERGYARNDTPPRELCFRLQVRRLTTEILDAANSRLPYSERDRLAAARVAIVGCGALGSGVARLLAKSGVGHFILVDLETLGWENIRRHQLGAAFVGHAKASMLAKALAQENPDVGSTMAHDVSVEHLLARQADALAGVDLIVAATASWSANSRLDALAAQGGPPVLYAWMEAHALAAHAVLIMPGHSYRAGYDKVGNPRLTASSSRKDVPPECGAASSPFGVVELAQAEILAGRLALDRLRGKVTETTWRSWLADAVALEEAEGRWTDDWLRQRGAPDLNGQTVAAAWWDA